MCVGYTKWKCDIMYLISYHVVIMICGYIINARMVIPEL